MKLLPGRGAAAALVSLSLTMRMLVELAIDFPNAANASWMCPLLGLIIFLPFLFAVRQAALPANQSPWENLRPSLPAFLGKTTEILFALLLIYDASFLARLTAGSYNVLALNHVTVHLLIFPLGVAIAAAILLKSDAVGNSSRIAMRIFAILIFLLFCVQVSEYRLTFLAPVLGAGIANILAGSIACAGDMALIALIWLIAQPDYNRRGLSRYVILSAAGASLLLAALHAGYPSMPEMDFTRASRIELVLSNGRMSLAPQFLLNILWYGGMLYMIAAESCAASCWLSFVFPGIPLKLLAFSEAAVITIAAVFYPSWLKNRSWLSGSMFVLIAAPLALSLLAYSIAKKGKNTCAN